MFTHNLESARGSYLSFVVKNDGCKVADSYIHFKSSVFKRS